MTGMGLVTQEFVGYSGAEVVRFLWVCSRKITGGMGVVPPFPLCYYQSCCFLDRVREGLHPIADIESLNLDFHRQYIATP